MEEPKPKTVIDMSEFDGSLENIRPLKSGRDAQKLATFAKSGLSLSRNQPDLEEQKRSFEDRIKSLQTNSDSPVDPEGTTPHLYSLLQPFP